MRPMEFTGGPRIEKKGAKKRRGQEATEKITENDPQEEKTAGEPKPINTVLGCGTDL